MQNLTKTRNNERLMKNLEKLSKELREKKVLYTTAVFLKGKEIYFIIIKAVPLGGKENVLAELIFIRKNNIKDILVVHANVKGLLIQAELLRTYFRIPYSSNLRAAFVELYKELDMSISDKFIEKDKRNRKKTKGGYSPAYNSEKKNRVYCKAVKRNPKDKKRTPYNTDKTKKLRPELYAILGNIEGISFCYSCNPEEERSDYEILDRLVKRNKRK